jgi:hypothetical protein
MIYYMWMIIVGGGSKYVILNATDVQSAPEYTASTCFVRRWCAASWKVAVTHNEGIQSALQTGAQTHTCVNQALQSDDESPGRFAASNAIRSIKLNSLLPPAINGNCWSCPHTNKVRFPASHKRSIAHVWRPWTYGSTYSTRRSWVLSAPHLYALRATHKSPCVARTDHRWSFSTPCAARSQVALPTVASLTERFIMEEVGLSKYATRISNRELTAAWRR